MLKTEPDIVALVPGDHEVRIDLRISRELSWFVGHFPECALLPGVVQVTWAIEFARQHLSLPPRFGSLAKMKFMRFILPDSTVSLLLEFDAAKGELWFEYREGEAVCSEGTVGFGL